MRKYIDEPEALRRDLMSRSLDDLRRERAALEERGNTLMGDADYWEYEDLEKIDRQLLGEMIDYDSAIQALQAMDKAISELSAEDHPNKARLNLRLLLAATMGLASSCEVLLQLGADVEANGEGDGSPLKNAASGGHVPTCRLLLSHGAQLGSASSDDGLTPMQLAVLCGHRPVVDYFVRECGENLEQLTYQGETLVELAARGGDNAEMVSYLRECLSSERTMSAVEDALDSALAETSDDMGHPDRIVGYDAALAELEDDEETADDDALNEGLRYAARQGYEHECRAYLDEGADIDDASTTGWTALRLAVANGHPEACDLLLSRGADPDAKGRGELTLLQLAVWYGQTAVVDYLVRERGANLDEMTSEGETLLQLAQRSDDNEEMVTHLMIRQSEKTMGTVDVALDSDAPPTSLTRKRHSLTL